MFPSHDRSGKLDVIVKAKEQQEKDEKLDVIRGLWDKEAFSLVTLEEVFNQKWLNKTTKLSTIETEIKEEIQTIKKDLVALDSFGEDTAQLKELYLSNLNLQITLQKGAELKANREKLAAMKLEQERIEAERSKTTEKNTEEQPQESQSVINDDDEQVTEDTVETKNVPEEEIKKETGKLPEYSFNIAGDLPTIEKIKAYVESSGIKIVSSITINGTIPQMQKIKEYLSDNGIIYDKDTIVSLNLH